MPSFDRPQLDKHRIVSYQKFITMLSYDSPISVNGPSPVSPTTMSPNRPVISSSKPVRHTKQADIVKSSNAMPIYTRSQTKHHHIWLVTGPAGCGKSTVAKHIADSLGMSYIEGDDVSLNQHPRPPYMSSD